jgi:hypothetical protein
MARPKKGRTGLVLAALAILSLWAGVGLGLLLGWYVVPVEYVGTKMADLAPEHKDQYIALLALAYSVDGDLDKAQARLAELDLPNPNQSVSSLIDRYIAEGRGEAEIRPLVLLADAMGIASPNVAAHLPSPTPPPTGTPIPSTSTPISPTDTPWPTDLPAEWTWDVWLLGPLNQPGQECEGGGQYIRVTVLDGADNQLSGFWVQEFYTGQTQETGHKAADPGWGVGEAEIGCAGNADVKVCLAQDPSGSCLTDYTRDMRCDLVPDVEDLFAAGYCECCEPGASLERCRELVDEGECFATGTGHFSWQVVFRRGW